MTITNKEFDQNMNTITVGDLKPSNLGFRQGNRTMDEYINDLSKGVKRQVKFFINWIKLHSEIYPKHSIQFTGVEILDKEGNLDKGDYRDGLDVILEIEFNGNVKKILLEIDCVEYNIPFARFKQRKIRRNLRRNAPIIHGQIGCSPSRLFIFSPEDLKIMDRKENYVSNDSDYRGKNPDGVYDGHPYYKLDVTSTSFVSVDFNTLSPKDSYEHLVHGLFSCKGL